MFDTYADAKYISTPILYRVDLGKSKVELLDEESAPEIPQHPVPRRSVADVARITTSRGTTVIAVVKDISTERRRTKKTVDEVADVTLVDNSTVPSGQLATIKVSVSGSSKLDTLAGQVGKPMAFFNVSADCSQPGKNLLPLP